MNKAVLTVAAMAVLVGGSASYAKSVSKDSQSVEKEFVSETTNSRMDKSVQKFVEAQKKNNQKRSVSVASDVLGRRGGAVKGKAALNYKVNDADVQKMKVVIRDVKVDEAPLAAVSGRYEYRPVADQKEFWLNGSKVSEKSYLDQAKKRKQKYDRSRKSFKSSRVAYLTASEIEKELASSETKYISEFKKPQPQVMYGQDGSWDYRYILNKAGVTNNAHNVGVKGQGVGVHYNEGGCVPLQYVNQNYFVQLETPCNEYSTHAIGVARILQTTAPQAKLYALQGTDGPENPSSYDVPILIGSNSWTYGSDYPYYEDTDATMDNYIYENRVVEFIAAGNEGRDAVIPPPARAFNVITVGAVSPADDMFMGYSTSKNPYPGNDKPEVGAYSHFRFPDKPYTAGPGDTYDGTFCCTSGATPFIAGMTADLLSQHQFLWWHPEVVRAILIAGSNPIQNPDYDIDDAPSGFDAGIPHYSNFSWTDSYRWNFWEGENSSWFDSNREITFPEYDITKGKRYRIAISWLTSGEFAVRYQSVAQDIDLSVWQDGVRIARSESPSNPFELVDFVARSSSPLTIKIKRYSNSSSKEKVVLGYAFVSKN